MRTFEEMFQARGDSKRVRFLSRLFGLFNEQVVMHWCNCEQAEFRNLGRPTLRSLDGKSRVILDFALENRHGPEREKVFIAEMKCWLAAEDGRHLRLATLDFVEPFSKENKSFRTFLDFAKAREAFNVSVKGQQRTAPVNGAILVWSARTTEGRTAALMHGISRVVGNPCHAQIFIAVRSASMTDTGASGGGVTCRVSSDSIASRTRSCLG